MPYPLKLTFVSDQTSTMAHRENFPAMDEIKQEMECIKNAKIGDVHSPLGRPAVASSHVDDYFNQAITFHRNVASLFTATSAFFSRDNVALPGVALYFKVLAQVEINDTWLIIDFLSKRGAVVHIGSTAAPPPDCPSCKDCSDVEAAFTNALAIAKVQYKKMNEHYVLAQKEGDGHAQCFIGNCLTAASEKVRCASHYVSHLKMVRGDKHAIKQFDCRLPCETADLAMAAAVESTIPSRLQLGSAHRACCYQTKEFEKSSCDCFERRRAAFNQTI